jgi:hypothetical protein
MSRKDQHVDLQHPANASVLAYLRRAWGPNAPASEDPKLVTNAYFGLGTHPDLVARLWDEITITLPVRAAWVVCGAPALVHPTSGVVFGFAGGSLVYALRLDPDALAEYERVVRERNYKSPRVHRYSNGKALDLDTIGADWVFGHFLPEEIDWCARAYAHAGSLSRRAAG